MAATADDEAAIREANAAGDDDLKPDDDRSIEELAGDEDEPVQLPPTQLAIEGTREKLSGQAGGKVPTESEIRIMGGRRPINGQLEKGETVTVLSTGTIREVDLIDHDDDWGNVSSTSRVHKMRQLHVRVATPETVMRYLIDMGCSREEVGVLFDEVAAGG